MAIHSAPLGGVRLSGDDARAFERQIADGEFSPLAQTALERGEKLLREMRDRGCRGPGLIPAASPALASCEGYSSDFVGSCVLGSRVSFNAAATPNQYRNEAPMSELFHTLRPVAATP